MPDSRGELAVDLRTLLGIVLALITILLVLQIVGKIISTIASLLGPFFLVLPLAIAVLIVLWFLDRL
ncbi:hypothetical protein ACFOZ7_16835 [Natribaculum luteum]|uniref:Major facilitator superfamily (MFS) profile domain-containing protein n=1 Tax=Natribaculum luteum TaxID=1586232 RepID=A0ABD5P2R5_9EURY|nr:hypothetical protein [Natribaculum luteum]